MVNPSRMNALLCRLRGDRSGAAAVYFALTMIVTMGMSAAVLDWGEVLLARRALQAAVDSAALAGAASIPGGNAVSVANSFSAMSGQANDGRGTAEMAPGYPQLRCLNSIGVTCTAPSNANAIVVRQTQRVPTRFARFIGIAAYNVSATATAGLTGGKPIPLEVMMVLDTTGSMNDANSSCSVPGSTKLSCAQAGGRTLMNGLAPSVNRVGLMTFPGMTSPSEASKQFNCSTDTPAIASYRNSPVYQVLPLGNDFRTDDKTTGLNTSSNVVRAFRGGGTGCAQGMSAPGGVATFYADAITAAQNALVASGRVNTQRVIILLSDGDSNASSGNMPIGRATGQCRQAITAANTAKAAGTWIYSIAYGASTSATGSCSTDSPRISACETMRQIASESAKFYVGNNGTSTGCTSAANAGTDLINVFSNIAKSFQQSRLLPDNVT